MEKNINCNSVNNECFGREKVNDSKQQQMSRFLKRSTNGTFMYAIYNFFIKWIQLGRRCIKSNRNVTRLYLRNLFLDLQLMSSYCVYIGKLLLKTSVIVVLQILIKLARYIFASAGAQTRLWNVKSKGGWLLLYYSIDGRIT